MSICDGARRACIPVPSKSGDVGKGQPWSVAAAAASADGRPMNSQASGPSTGTKIATSVQTSAWVDVSALADRLTRARWNVSAHVRREGRVTF